MLLLGVRWKQRLKNGPTPTFPTFSLWEITLNVNWLESIIKEAASSWHIEQAQQAENRRLCGNSYCNDYLDYIYVNEIGQLIRPGYLTSHLSLLLKKHNMRHIRFHDLRHSCATLLLANGVELKDIQTWLGHSTIGTTANIYIHQEFSSKIASANAIIHILQQ